MWGAKTKPASGLDQVGLLQQSPIFWIILPFIIDCFMNEHCSIRRAVVDGLMHPIKRFFLVIKLCKDIGNISFGDILIRFRDQVEQCNVVFISALHVTKSCLTTGRISQSTNIIRDILKVSVYDLQTFLWLILS